MFSPILVMAVLVAYMLVLVGLAAWTEKRSPRARALADSPAVYVLSLGVYCSAWTFYGSVGVAARSGFLYLAIYLGPTLVWLLGWTLIRRLARFKAAQRVSNLGDFLAARYGRTAALPALATLLALAAINPYIALQLKAILSTFKLMAGDGLAQGWPAAAMAVELLVVAFVTALTAAFGLRQLDPTQRQRGMMVVLACESLVKLVAFLAAGLFVTYGLYDGLGDLFQRAATLPAAAARGGDGGFQGYLTFMNWLLLSMGAILFLPRQFHVAIVELPRLSHLRSAMWGFPLYLLAISFFVYPIAAAGLLHGYPLALADSLVLTLPLEHGEGGLALLVFLGGFSAAVGMITACSMTLSVMVANNLVMPLAERFPGLRGLRRRGLAVRWAAMTAIILAGYLFEKAVGDSYFLVAMGLISFAGVLQFAPAILVGLWWRQASRSGALWGLGAGFALWVYTLFLPAMAKSGWLPVSFLLDGPFGLAWLRPEALFGMDSLGPLAHGTLWSLSANVALFILGSCWAPATAAESRVLAEVQEGRSLWPNSSGGEVPAIRLSDKLAGLRRVLGDYLPAKQVEEILEELLVRLQLGGREQLSHQELLRFLGEGETALAGAIGAAAAHAAMGQSQLVTAEESREIARLYSRILASMNLSPEELRRRVDYYQDRNEIMNRHAAELADKVARLKDEVAARAQAEAALRESEMRFRAMADSAPVMIWMSEADGSRSYFNRAWLHFTGRPLAEELRWGWQAGLFTGDREGWDERLAEDRPYSMEYRLRRHDGEYRWLAEEAVPRHSATGEFLGCIGSCLDISDMKAAADALRRSRDELEALVAARTAELSRANASLTEEIAQRRRAEESLLASYAELKRMNEKLGQAQNQLLQSEKMASIGQLAAGVAHEINNPIGFVNSNLGTLRGYIDQLLNLLDAYRDLEDQPGDPAILARVRAERAAADLDYLREDIPALVRETLDGIQRVRRIVRDLKDFSHVDEGEWQETDLHAGLDSTLNVVWNELKYKARVVKEYGSLPEIPCIPSQLNQVFMNLLVNAAQAIPDQGTITIRTGTAGDWVWVEVEDTGKGIPPENMNRIFEPFFTTKPVGKGTGLGLSVSYGIVRKHGGRIEVASEPGKGTRFRIWLPRIKQEEEASA